MMALWVFHTVNICSIDFKLPYSLNKKNVLYHRTCSTIRLIVLMYVSGRIDVFMAPCVLKILRTATANSLITKYDQLQKRL